MNESKLRFKEFSGEVKYAQTNSFFEHIRNGFVGTATPYYTDDTGVKYLQSNNIKNGKISGKNFVYVTREFHNKYKKNELKLNDMLMVQSGVFTGECAVVNNEYVGTNCHALIIMTPKATINTHYLNYYLHSYLGRKELNKYITGQTIQHILASDMKKVIFPNVKLEEQKKIADFFSLLDAKIQFQKQKIDLLQEQKKGYMQKIFKQEIRFKDDDGGEYTEWNTYTLNELGETYTGLSGKTKDDFGYGNHKFVTYVNVFNNLFAKENGVEKVDIGDHEKQALVEKGDIFFTTSSETPLEVGMASIWKHAAKKLHLNSFCFGYRVTNTNCLPTFLAITLRSQYMRKKIVFLAQGSTRYNISKTELMKESVFLPAIGEQKKIIDFYLKLSSKVEFEQQKLEALQEQKKGFMQQMFI
ncbi:restriction endonuclease subunit S [Bacillus thuringiensis]|uniref:restriction endonuclease subunit S n=1 Tax=Bacillus thuringiensis TaxID=1428 RepID=UPI000BF847F5|nr:restriction endonuclease subunit S [Bacillus thuringiensis]PFU57002.1 hypothetical protein COK85_22405 [Bacillus thuringiensis]